MWHYKQENIDIRHSILLQTDLESNLNTATWKSCGNGFNTQRHRGRVTQSLWQILSQSTMGALSFHRPMKLNTTMENRPIVLDKQLRCLTNLRVSHNVNQCRVRGRQFFESTVGVVQ
eukprot:Gb_16232 [translate_table: standard]